jgi:hypothetical protein
MRLHFGRRAAAALVVLGIGLGLSGARAANLDEACGGPSGITCNSALWCRLPDGQCSTADAAGTCEKMPDFCMRVSRPVCACSGKTYPNECELRKAKAQFDHTGPCKTEPAKTEGAPKKRPPRKPRKH